MLAAFYECDATVFRLAQVYEDAAGFEVHGLLPWLGETPRDVGPSEQPMCI